MRTDVGKLVLLHLLVMELHAADGKNPDAPRGTWHDNEKRPGVCEAQTGLLGEISGSCESEFCCHLQFSDSTWFGTLSGFLSP